MIATSGHPLFRLDASQPRIVAADYLVTFETNRYSVPFPLIGQAVEVRRTGDSLEIMLRGRVVAGHRLLFGRYQLSILPEHGPAVLARGAPHRQSTPVAPSVATCPEVEVRDLTTYDALCRQGGAA